MPERLETSVLELLPFLERRQAAVGLFLGRLVVLALLVGREEASERDHGPGGGELGIGAVRRSGSQAHRDGLSGRVRHLRGDRPPPDELVEGQPVPVELALDLLRGAEAVAGGTDRLVGFLRVLHLPVVETGFGGNRVRAKQRTRLVSRGLEGGLGERGRVRSHVGDVAVVVQPLGDPHRRLGAEPELAARLLLKSRGHERRSGLAPVRLPLDRADREVGLGQRLGKSTGGRFVEMDEIGASELRIGPEIASLGNCAPVQGDEARGELAGVEYAVDVPVGGGDERDPGSLALDDQARGHGLNAAGGEALRDLLPENGRDLVPIETVEDPARLLGVDEPAVYVPGLLEGALDRIRGDLVEDHAAHRNLRLQHLDQVPRRSPRPRGLRPSRAGARPLRPAASSGPRPRASCRDRRRRRARSLPPCSRRAAPTAPSSCSPGCRRRAQAGRGRVRCSTRRRNPARGSRRSSSLSRETRR